MSIIVHLFVNKDQTHPTCLELLLLFVLDHNNITVQLLFSLRGLRRILTK